jgi:hypothetical protein
VLFGLSAALFVRAVSLTLGLAFSFFSSCFSAALVRALASRRLIFHLFGNLLPVLGGKRIPFGLQLSPQSSLFSLAHRLQLFAQLFAASLFFLGGLAFHASAIFPSPHGLLLRGENAVFVTARFTYFRHIADLALDGFASDYSGRQRAHKYARTGAADNTRACNLLSAGLDDLRPAGRQALPASIDSPRSLPGTGLWDAA